MSTDHNTEYPVFESADECPHPEPDDTPGFNDWMENHPTGEGLGTDLLICKLSPLGVFCQECSQDAGDWIGHQERERCPGCDREKGVDDDYGRDEDCDECFIDGAPDTQEAVTAGWSPLPVWMNRNDERNPE